MKISKLYSIENIKDSFINNGSIERLDGRCSGKTTGIAMCLIGEAMSQPGTEQYYSAPLAKHTEYMVGVCQGLVHQLGLKHLVVGYDSSKHRVFIKYNIYYTMDDIIRQQVELDNHPMQAIETPAPVKPPSIQSAIREDQPY